MVITNRLSRKLKMVQEVEFENNEQTDERLIIVFTILIHFIASPNEKRTMRVFNEKEAPLNRKIWSCSQTLFVHFIFNLRSNKDLLCTSSTI